MIVRVRVVLERTVVGGLNTSGCHLRIQVKNIYSVEGVKFLFIETDWYQLMKPGFHLSGKSQTIGDYVISRPSKTFPTPGNSERHLPRRIFISRQCLGRSGNNKIPDDLGFFRHMKTRLYYCNVQN